MSCRHFYHEGRSEEGAIEQGWGLFIAEVLMERCDEEPRHAQHATGEPRCRFTVPRVENTPGEHEKGTEGHGDHNPHR